MKKLLKIMLLLLVEIAMSSELDTLFEAPTKVLEGSSKILSRRKRFLIFPDGSSVQLVFCTQNHGYIQLGDIVWFANTAALAWELPTDPKLFNYFKRHDKFYTAQNRDGVSKTIYFLNEDGKVISKMPYKRKPLLNPALAKRSIDSIDEELKNMSRQDLHKRHRDVNIFETHNKDEIEFHREGRRSLYGQLETYIQALGWRGRECVLRLLCEAGKGKGQSSFLEEIIKATFTLPEGQDFVDNLHKDYDEAHRSKGNCVDLYPKCEEYIKSK